VTAQVAPLYLVAPSCNARYAVTVVLREPSIQNSTVYFESKEAPINLDYSPKLTIHWASVVREFSTFFVLPFFMIEHY
jgi:hypothetical protein